LNAWPRLVALGRPKRLNRIACLGNPDTGDPNEALPGTELEVRDVARLFAQSSVHTGRDASYYQLAISAQDADVLHLACHALPVDEYGNRALILAPTDRHSGRVSYDGLYRLQTPAFLASLSCCSTGLGQEMAGDELLGFSRGFLAAGVPSLMVSLWDVPDRSTAKLTTEFYRELREHDLATALQKAQQKTAASYPSPWHWAAFTVYGVWDPAVVDE
jgi:CHAT domain-containing protein